jgi:hypothetical protein
MEIRTIRKRFLCRMCNLRQSKLVHAYESLSRCHNCNSLMSEITEDEYNTRTRDEVNKNYRIVFDEANRNEYKNIYDTNEANRRDINIENNRNFIGSEERQKINSNPNSRQSSNQYENNNSFNRGPSPQRNPDSNNSYNPFNIFTERESIFTVPSYLSSFIPTNNSQNQRRTSNLQGHNNFFDNFFSNFGVSFPFSESPFMGRINRHSIDNEIFDPNFELFGSTFNNFFIDNFSSNFRSNYRSRESFFDILNSLRSSRRPEETKNSSTSKEALNALKKFKMNRKYCKKNDKGDLEYPNCSICLSDISSGEETLLIPCGHLFHSGCSIPWLKKNNTCPICRFELPAEN